MRLHFFSDSRVLARRVAAACGIEARPVALHRFPDAESLVRVDSDGERDTVLFRSLHQPNLKLIEVLLAADALRRAGARRVSLVAPYLPYMRQDRVFAPGQPVSQRVIGGLLGAAFDRVLTIEAHLHRIRRLSEILPGVARSLPAVPVVADWVRRLGPRTLLVGPDMESAVWVRKVARLADLPWVVGVKQRHADRRVRVELPDLPAARRAVILDDIVSSGATLAATARALRRAGVALVDALVVHAIVAPGAADRLRRAGIGRLLSCDTVPHRSNALSVAPLLADAIRSRR